MKFAIVYYSKHGQTRKISNFLKKCLTSNARSKDVVYEIDVCDEYDCTDLKNGVDHLILGCPVYVGHFPRKFITWVKNNKENFDQKPISVFMVSLNAADPRQQAKVMNGILLKKLIEMIQVQPIFFGSFPGSLEYTKYGFFLKLLMRKISKSAGGPTDTSKNHELTDWPSVEQFARAIQSRDLLSPYYNQERDHSIHEQNEIRI